VPLFAFSTIISVTIKFFTRVEDYFKDGASEFSEVYAIRKEYFQDGEL
jgi:hypothetical protein